MNKFYIFSAAFGWLPITWTDFILLRKEIEDGTCTHDVKILHVQS